MKKTPKQTLVIFAFLFSMMGLLVYGYMNSDTNVIFSVLFLMVAFVFVLLSMEIAKVAKEKGRSYGVFFVLSLLFSPIIMGIVSATMSPLPGSKRYIPMVVESAGSVPSSEVDQIEKLGDLLSKGLVTQAEFDQKKSELLDRL